MGENTHSDQCFRWHAACAEGEVLRSREEIRRLQEQLRVLEDRNACNKALAGSRHEALEIIGEQLRPLPCGHPSGCVRVVGEWGGPNNGGQDAPRPICGWCEAQEQLCVAREALRMVAVDCELNGGKILFSTKTEVDKVLAAIEKGEK